MRLIWTEEQQPNQHEMYHHIISETPFGRFLITWKGWKEDWQQTITIDETPWGDCHLIPVVETLGNFKQLCEDEMNNRLLLCDNLAN